MPVQNLNEHHLRRLATAMIMVDAACARILDLLDGRSSPATMTVWENSLSVEQSELIRSQIKELQTMTRQLAREYSLQKQRKEMKQSIRADVSQIWTILENCRPKRMKGMGVIGKSTAEILDNDLADVLELVNKVLKEVE